MHGSIIVITDKDSLDTPDDCTSPWSEEELRQQIPNCDYVARDEASGFFVEEIRAFSEYYDLEIGVEEIKGEIVGVLTDQSIQALKESLERREAERIRNIRKEISKDRPYLWKIAQEAYDDSPVYFVVPYEFGFYSEVSFLDSLRRDEIKGPLYITETFSFHI